jgi:hypothetical protein
MAEIGKYARITLAREAVWEILRADDHMSMAPFTMREFYQRHRTELDSVLTPISPGSTAETMVRGALQSLSKKGLIFATRRWGETTYEKNIYMLYRSLIPYHYGQAMVAAQRLRLL